jgi:hypothetical protein
VACPWTVDSESDVAVSSQGVAIGVKFQEHFPEEPASPIASVSNSILNGVENLTSLPKLQI